MGPTVASPTSVASNPHRFKIVSKIFEVIGLSVATKALASSFAGKKKKKILELDCSVAHVPHIPKKSNEGNKERKKQLPERGCLGGGIRAEGGIELWRFGGVRGAWIVGNKGVGGI